jgi:putative tryptophan/tyrosine transport system substrate-binding protein
MNVEPTRPRTDLSRRAWLAGALGLLALAAPARAQTTARVFRIGLLGGSSPTSPEAGHVWQAFFQELRDLGYVEGRNLIVEGRYYGDRLDQVQGFAAELVRLRVDVILAAAAPAPEAARRVTDTIPIVMANHPDPVGSGLAASLARPGGNVTGLSLLAPEMRVKQLEMLKEVLPRLSRVAFLRHPSIPLDMRDLERATQAMGLSVLVVQARVPEEFAAAFAAATRARAGALAVLAGSMFFAHRASIAELAARHRLPTVYLLREHVEAGGFMAYGVDLRDNFRRAAAYVDRILRGADPADLPIERPRKFLLAVNLKAAKGLGITVPPSVLTRADQIIE